MVFIESRVYVYHMVGASYIIYFKSQYNPTRWALFFREENLEIRSLVTCVNSETHAFAITTCCFSKSYSLHAIWGIK